MELNWDLLVSERDAWVAHNFPDPDGRRTPLDSVLGCIEELGELTHHHLKQVQSIRGTDEFHQAEARDAVGDLTVYLLGVMSHHGVRPQKTSMYTEERLDADVSILYLAYWVGTLAHFQRRSGTQLGTVTHIVENLRRYCQARSWNYERIVQDTWSHVKQRDWIKYPESGKPVQT